MSETLKPGRKPVKDKKVGITIYIPSSWKKKAGAKLLRAAHEGVVLEAARLGLK